MGIAADIAIILVAALLGGIVARRLGQPLMLGYIVAGILVGPFGIGPTVAEAHTIELLAEIGVALLLFALGLEFHFGKLAHVRGVAFLGAPAQIVLCMALGWGLGRLLGWSSLGALWLGAAVALSSTMVTLKTLGDQGALGTLASQVIIGVLIVQDLAVVPMLIILPELGDLRAGIAVLGWAVLQAGLFLAAMIFVGTRLIPFVLRRIAAWDSRELFLLALMALGVGVGYGTYLVGLSFAFGSFVAGMVLSESDYSHHALSEIVPLRDLFGMLFFVSVGMLLDPQVLLANAGAILLLVGGIGLGKALIITAITWAFGYRGDVPLTVGLGLFQVGEFAFVLSRAGLAAGALSADQYHLILATTLATMVLTPAVGGLGRRINGLIRRRYGEPPGIAIGLPHQPQDHILIAGYGRVGAYAADLLQQIDLPYVVIERDQSRLDLLKARQVPVIYGDAGSAIVLEAAGLQRARMLLVAVSSSIDVELIVRQARAQNPQLHIVARATQIGQLELLGGLGIYEVVQPEFEAGLEMVRQALLHEEVPASEIARLSDAVRAEQYRPMAALRASPAILGRLRRLRQGALDLAWYPIGVGSPLVGQSIEASAVRRRTGVSIVVLLRDDLTLANPPSDLRLAAGDQVAVLGTGEQCAAFAALSAGRGG